jgi:dynein heavy chain
MIVGLPFSGKTTSYEVLAGALTHLALDEKKKEYEKVEITKLNPKAITMT